MVIVMMIDVVYTRIVKGKTEFKFWVVEPTANHQNRAVGSLDECMQSVKERLNYLRFESSITQDEGTENQIVEFGKPKRKQISNFLDHKFSGRAILNPSYNIVDIHTHLKFEDTLLVETGETIKLQAICEFITLKTPDLNLKGVPFTLCCGLIPAYEVIIIGLFAKNGSSISYGLLNSISAVGMGTILLSFFFALKNKRDFMGWRLAFSGLYIAAIPYSAWIVSMLT